MKGFFFGLIIATGWLGCGSFDEPYAVGISQVDIQEANVKNLRAQVDLRIHNPNNIGVDLSRAELEVFSDGSLLGTVDQGYEVKMPPQSDFDLPITIILRFDELFEGDVLKALSFANQVISERKISIQIKGHIYAGKQQVKFKIPIDRSETVEF